MLINPLGADPHFLFGFLSIIYESIAAEEELRDIATIVVGNVEFTAWVHPFVAIHIENQVVEKDERSA